MTKIITLNSQLTTYCYIIETETQKCYFYDINSYNFYFYEGNGLLWNANLNKFTESKRQELRSDSIGIKVFGSSVECGVSGKNGAFYTFNESMYFNYFSRKSGEYLLRIYDSNRILRKFKVNSGGCYYIINSEKCVNIESNLFLPLYEIEDEK